MTPHVARTRIEGATAALGTLHGKDAQIRPALARVQLRLLVEPIDTDRFGTFSGRIERAGPAERVVVAKATAAAESAGCALGVASEGSFFIHPAMPFATTDLELVALVDRTSGLVVIGRSQQLAPWAEPGTDLRAHRCLPRQPNIAAAAADLATRLRRRCPSCDAPGVGRSRTVAGRPCSWCGGPTLELHRTVESCPTCDWERVVVVAGTADPGACESCNP